MCLCQTYGRGLTYGKFQGRTVLRTRTVNLSSIWRFIFFCENAEFLIMPRFIFYFWIVSSSKLLDMSCPFVRASFYMYLCRLKNGAVFSGHHFVANIIFTRITYLNLKLGGTFWSKTDKFDFFVKCNKWLFCTCCWLLQTIGCQISIYLFNLGFCNPL